VPTSSTSAGPPSGDLRRISDHAHLAAAAEPQVEQRCLDGADVLELVHDEPAVLAVNRGGHPLLLAEDRRRTQQHVLHVDALAALLDLLVDLEELRHLGQVVVVHLTPGRGGQSGVVDRADVAHLRPLDLRCKVTQHVLGRRHAEAAGGLAHERQLGRPQLWQLRAVHLGPEVAGLPQRSGVEGPGLNPRRTEAGQTGPELRCGARRERDGQHLARPVGTNGRPVRDPMRDRAGLAGAGARQHPYGALEGERHLPLLGIQRFQQLLRLGQRDTPHSGDDVTSCGG
jgi:hypothetical protein